MMGLFVPVVGWTPETGNDAFTKSLLHFDGTDASTTITDDNAGGSAKTWTAFGNAQLDTGITKFGTATLLLDGTGDYVSTPDHADLTVGSGDFTVDFWFNRAGGDGANRFLFCHGTGADAGTGLAANLTTGNVVRGYAGQVTPVLVVGTTAFTATGWHHVAFVRTGDILKLFIDGVQEGGDVAISGSVNDAANVLAVGRLGSANNFYFNGSIEEFRYSVGIARWVGNFTPPTRAYF